MSTHHPKAVEHALLREARKKEQAEKRAEEASMQQRYSLRFAHIRATRPDFRKGISVLLPKGGATLAFVRTRANGVPGDFVKVAIAHTHKKDAYCRREGRYHAACRFDDGQFITLRIPRATPASSVLKRVFKEVI